MKKALLFLISGIAWGACASPPYANGYFFCREITIDHTKVPSTQGNFPMVVCFGTTMGAACSTNSKELATGSNGGKLLNSNGYDFIFTSDNAGTTPIAYERVIQNLTTGEAELWVLIASLSSSADTKIYLFYQNASVSTDQSNGTAVWDSNYKVVTHFTQLTGGLPINPTIVAADSTSNGNGLLMRGASGAVLGDSGKIGAAAEWNSQGDLFNLSPTGMPTGSGPRTLEAWINTTASGFNQTANCIGSDATDQRFALWLVDSPNTWSVEGGGVRASFSTTPGGWQHLVLTLPGGSTTFMGVLAYVNGVQQTLSNLNNWTDTVNTVIGEYRVGGLCGRDREFILATGGRADESRVSDIARSADWIAAEYNNQNSPNTFYSLGPEVPSNGGRTIIIN